MYQMKLIRHRKNPLHYSGMALQTFLAAVALSQHFFYQIHGPFKDTLGDILLIVSIGL